MSISGLYLGTRSLNAQQMALEVLGQNISNVNNSDYTRQRVKLTSSPPVTNAFGQIGTGVQVDGIEQIRDNFLEKSIRDQKSELGKSTIAAGTYDTIESIFNDPSDIGLNNLLGNFFDSLSDLSNSPEDIGVRQSVIERGQTLAGQMNFINTQFDQLRMNIDTNVKDGVTQINSLANQIATLNTQIVKTEAGVTQQANDLRDQREGLVKQLSELTDINTSEMDTGAINISIGGTSLVFGGTATTLSTQIKEGDDLPVSNVVMAGTNTVIDFTGGKMAGYLEARDSIIPSYSNDLDTLAQTVINEVNRVHVNGRGLEGFSSLTSANAVTDSTAALANAGLSLTPVATSFQLAVINESDSSETSTNITINPATQSLDDLAATLDAIDGISASVNTTTNKLEITADSGYQFSFGNVTDNNNNLLSALGLNTFFTGSDASDIAVNNIVADNVSYIAAAQSGSQGDNNNALQLAQLRSTAVADNNSKTIEEFYQSNIVALGSDKNDADIQAEGGQSYLDKLELKRQSISGVNLDEEAANLILFQRAYEATARYISVVDQMLNVLINSLG
jgi:flagellar hook-associated protein 1